MRSSCPRRAGSASISISTIFPPPTVKPITENGRPRSNTTTPAVPFTSAGRAKGANCEKVRACSATACAPRTSLKAHGEHVVQHERKPLGGSERFKYHEQRQTYRVSQ